MEYKDEAAVKRALGIDTWQRLSRDSVLKFAAKIPEFDKDVAIKLIEKFPAFKDLALGTLAHLEKEHLGTLAGNKDSQEHVHSAYKHTRDVLEGQLASEDLSAEDRLLIMTMIKETADRESDKDSENKNFLKALFDTTAAVSGAALVLAIVFIGGKIAFEGKSNGNS